MGKDIKRGTEFSPFRNYYSNNRVPIIDFRCQNESEYEKE